MLRPFYSYALCHGTAGTSLGTALKICLKSVLLWIMLYCHLVCIILCMTIGVYHQLYYLTTTLRSCIVHYFNTLTVAIFFLVKTLGLYIYKLLYHNNYILFIIDHQEVLFFPAMQSDRQKATKDRMTALVKTST